MVFCKLQEVVNLTAILACDIGKMFPPPPAPKKRKQKKKKLPNLSAILVVFERF